ncbi:response regulator transcription factor [Hydrogenimonas sp.]
MPCSGRLARMKVVLVEDEPRLAGLLKEAIGDYFERFVVAYDGIEGVAKIRDVKPDVLITDITMPKMNGLEMTGVVKKEFPDLPVVILSAYSDKEKLLGAIDAGVVKYFIKPFDPEELLTYLCSLAKTLKKRSLIALKEPFAYDLQSEQLFKNGILIHLSQRESRFIAQLLHSPNNYLSNEAIKERLWEDENVSDERLRTFIRRVRKKSDKSLIENISGQGYVLRVKNGIGD